MNHWGGRKAALGFVPDRIGTLVSMATDNGEHLVSTLAPLFFDRIFFIIAGKEDTYNVSNVFENRHDSTRELSTLEPLKNIR